MLCLNWLLGTRWKPRRQQCTFHYSQLLQRFGCVCTYVCVWQPWWPPRTHVIAWAAPQLMDAIDCPVLLLYGTPPNLLSPRIKGGTMTLPLFKIATSAQLKFSLLFIITLFKYTSFTSNCPLCFPELSYPSSLLLLFAPLIAFSVSPAIKMIGDCVMYINVLVLRVVSLCMLLYFLVKKKKKTVVSLSAG